MENSVKEVCGDSRKNDTLKNVISNVNDTNLMHLKDFGRLARYMRGKQGNRIKSLITVLPLNILVTVLLTFASFAWKWF